MSEQPWMKFYPRDWRGDQALRAVSVAARGLWIECLCIMHEAKPYGHLLLNGNRVEDDALARMTGVPVDEVSALLAELRQAGVLSLTGKGVIFSRRMTKDHGRAQKGRKAARKRWSQDAEKPAENAPPNRSSNRSPITQKPEARDISNDMGEPPTLSQRLWGDGLAYLMRCGMPEKHARSQLGKWRNGIGEGQVVAAIAHCQAKSISDPNAYIEGISRNGSGGAADAVDRQEWLRKHYGVTA